MPGVDLSQNTLSMQDYLSSIAFQSVADQQGFQLGELGAGAQNRGEQFGVERAAYNLLDEEGAKTGMDALLTGNGGLAWGYIDPSWTGLQRIQQPPQVITPPVEEEEEETPPVLVPPQYKIENLGLGEDFDNLRYRDRENQGSYHF
jgi:hypothetical protein